MKALKQWLVASFLSTALLALARPAAAQDATPAAVTDDEVNRIAKKLYCPVCENVPLDVCPTQACAQWRATIREKRAAGWSEQQILDYFVAQYGERVLAQPSTRGLNIFVWIVPPLALAGGAFALWRFLRQMRRPAPAQPPAPPTDEYAARLERELQERR
jgi:cytochrome c-type biogenesis protein CcmH